VSGRLTAEIPDFKSEMGVVGGAACPTPAPPWRGVWPGASPELLRVRQVSTQGVVDAAPRLLSAAGTSDRDRFVQGRPTLRDALRGTTPLRLVYQCPHQYLAVRGRDPSRHRSRGEHLRGRRRRQQQAAAPSRRQRGGAGRQRGGPVPAPAATSGGPVPAPARRPRPGASATAPSRRRAPRLPSRGTAPRLGATQVPCRHPPVQVLLTPPSASTNRRRTLFVMRETPSSTSRQDGQVIDPTEKTAPPLGVSWSTMSDPPSSGLSPLAR